MKNFKVVSRVSEGGDIRTRGFKRLAEKERHTDFTIIKLSERFINNTIDDFEDGFNHIIEDGNGKLYEAILIYVNGAEHPMIWREVERIEK